MVEAREDADPAAGLIQQPVVYDSNAIQIANERLDEENQKLRDENAILRREVEFYRSQAQALRDHIEGRANMDLALVKNSGPRAWCDKLTDYLNEVSIIKPGAGSCATLRAKRK